MLILQNNEEEDILLMMLEQKRKEDEKLTVRGTSCPVCQNTKFYFYRETAVFKCCSCKNKFRVNQTNGKLFLL